MNQRPATALYTAARAWNQLHWPDDLPRVKALGPDTLARMSATEFLSSYCWVVYASGFKAKVLKSLFPRLRAAFHEFDIDLVAEMESLDAALEVFGNTRKARSFVRGAGIIRAEGFDGFKARLLEQKMDALQKLPGIGAITKKHLARNIGLVDVAKDDVWLVRVATLLGASCVDSLVAHLAKGAGDGPGAIDLVLWRFCTEAGWKDLGYTSLDEMVCGVCD